MEECARVASQLRQQGLHLSDDFIRAAIAEGTSSEDSTKAVYEKSLHCDFNICATGCLPSTIDTWNKRVLDGRTVLQVDEVTDTAASAKQRYANLLFGHPDSSRIQCLYKMSGVYGTELSRIHCAGMMRAEVVPAA